MAVLSNRAGPDVQFRLNLYNRTNAQYQVPVETYRQNLLEIVARLQSAGRRIIWATITPVIDDRHAHRKTDFDRYERDVRSYNAAALEVMSSAGFDINDLHSVVHAAGVEDCIGPDGVHMTDAGYRTLARPVIAACRKVPE